MATRANKDSRSGASAQTSGRPAAIPAHAAGPPQPASAIAEAGGQEGLHAGAPAGGGAVHPAGGTAGAAGAAHHVGAPTHGGGPEQHAGAPAHRGVRDHRASGPRHAGEHGRVVGPRHWGLPIQGFGGPRHYIGRPEYWRGGIRPDRVGRWHWLYPRHRWPWFYRGTRIPLATVVWAQACLSQLLRIALPQDGIIGPETQQAIASFQAQQQFPSTGMLDDNTLSALQAACGDQQEGAFGREFDEYEGFDDPFEERDVEPAGSGGTGRMVDPAKVDCERLDRGLPIFRAIGTTEPVSVLEAACQRAVAMLDTTIAELSHIRERVRAGEPPAFPLIGDLLGWSLQTRMLMRVGDASAWTGGGPRTAEQIIRWLTNIRQTIAGGELRYVCLSSRCKTNSRALSFRGRLEIHLCRLFWRSHLEFQAQTIINRVSHIYYDTKVTGRGPGSAYCIAQFIADANGSPIRPEDIGRCGPGAPALHHEAEYEESYDIDEPEWPQWPTSRTFNPPPAQTIPTGPFRTAPDPSCQSIQDDYNELLFAVEGLKSQLRQRPSKPALVTKWSDNVRALSRQIVARLKNLTYVQSGCTRHDLEAFASLVNALRGGGTDSDSGSWPPASTGGEREPRKAARESLRHMLAWIRRAARMYPQI